MKAEQPESQAETGSVHRSMPKLLQISLEENTESLRNSPPAACSYLQGWKLRVAAAALCLSIFLANFEVSVVGTALISITSDLHGFSKADWIVTAYLLTFLGFLIIWAKLSDVLGSKPLMLISLSLFIAFSAGAGASQTMNQLIICRAFQGIGGSGVYSLSMVMFVQLVPDEKYPALLSLVSCVFGVSLLLGPIVGGAISNGTTWRWIFLLNVPTGIFALALLLIAIPNGFPYHGLQSTTKKSLSGILTLESLRRIDFVGAILLLVASMLFVAALQVAEIYYPWSSSLVISFLAVSGVVLVFFLGYEWLVSHTDRHPEPVFPWRFLKNRVWMGTILNCFVAGAPFTMVIIAIPQRFQVVNENSSITAGLRLLPFAVATPLGSGLSSLAAGRLKIPPIYILLAGAILQTVGYAFLSTIPTSGGVWPGQYGYDVIAALGTGANIAILYLVTPFTVEERDKSVAMGCIVQFRFMGGAIGLAVANSIMNSWLKSKLSPILPAEELSALLETTTTISMFPPDLQKAVRIIFAKGYNLQMKAVLGFAVAQFPATLLMWTRKPLSVN